MNDNDINDFNFEGEKIKIGGKEFTLQYNIKVMKKLASEYGSLSKAFEKIYVKEQTEEFYNDLLKFLELGIDDETVTVEWLEKVIQFKHVSQLIQCITKTMHGSIPNSKNDTSDDNSDDKKK